MSYEDQVAVEQVLAIDREASIKDALLNRKPLPQPECTLYSEIPGEIRTRIFALALREFEDKSEPYRPNRVYYRPGCHYHTKVGTFSPTLGLEFQEAVVSPNPILVTIQAIGSQLQALDRWRRPDMCRCLSTSLHGISSKTQGCCKRVNSSTRKHE